LLAPSGVVRKEKTAQLLGCWHHLVLFGKRKWDSYWVVGTIWCCP